jgi:hypothetical protein
MHFQTGRCILAQALPLANEFYSMKLDLLTHASVIDNTIGPCSDIRDYCFLIFCYQQQGHEKSINTIRLYVKIKHWYANKKT